jgi:hypothetical protein
LGLNNPHKETGRFSLRSELFRVQAGNAGRAARCEVLSRHIVPNLLDLPEFQRYCIPFTPQQHVELSSLASSKTVTGAGRNATLPATPSTSPCASWG